MAVVLADFDAIHEGGDMPAEVPIDRSDPLAREWTLIVDAPGAKACLAAWELPSQEELPDSQRRFEVLWSVEPEVVRSATELAAELLWRLAPSVAQRIPAPPEDAATTADELRFANALSQRMVNYLGNLVDRGSGPA
jgi:DICT domain-containing protein